MASGGKFHLFLRLLVEIQLLVWKFYTDNRSAIRHCFFGQNPPSYASFDKDGGLLSYKFAAPGEDANCISYSKISFRAINLWNSQHPPHSIAGVEEMFREGQTTSMEFVSIWVEFERDVFYFLRGCDDFFPATRNFTEEILGDRDKKILVGMKQLKVVWLIVTNRPGREDWKQPEGASDATGFMNLKTFKRLSGRLLSNHFRKAYKTRSWLASLFKEHDMKVKVRIGVDLYSPTASSPLE
ncbi:hypothetical protein F5Y06DRAFT_303132 [Hypoxylon sp. FL0890]|nr:hypothetical protein F5Y06DRAFT_303132 [Hypoxylon sp. FL0890]